MRNALILVSLLLLLSACQEQDRQPASDAGRPPAPLLDPVTSPTNLASQTLSGQAPPNASVLASAGASVAQTTADATGAFSLAINLKTSPAANTVNEVEVTYLEGSVTSEPARARIVHDPVPPAPPEITPGQSPTNLNPLPLQGLAEPNAAIQVTATGGSASGRASGTGAFTLQIPLVPNAYNLLYLTATDAAGNVSLPAQTTILHDGVPPSPANPLRLRAFFDGDRTVVIGNWWCVEPNANVRVEDITAMAQPVSVQADGAGAFVASLPAGADGNTVEVAVVDPAGNVSDPPHASVQVSLNWNDLSPLGAPPSYRVWAPASVDAANDRMFVFGGRDVTGAVNDGHFLDLARSFESWSLLGAASPPAARYGHSLVFDTQASRFLLFGGHDPAGPSWFDGLHALDVSTPGAETWSAPGGNTPPSGRAFHACTFDPATRRMYVFGGRNASGFLGDLWECDLGGASPDWTGLHPAGTAPPALAGATAAFDPVNERLLLFGGRRETGVLTNRLRVLDLADAPAWAILSATGAVPSPREGACGAFEPVSSLFFLFGGDTDSARLNDLHILDMNTGAWASPSPGGDVPAVREGATMVFDPARLRQVVFGGSSNGDSGTFYRDAIALE